MLNRNAKRWVKALRSGEYTQTACALRNKDGFCCLGVACDLYEQTHKTARWDVNVDIDVFLVTPNAKAEGAKLPLEVMKWLGLRTQTGYTGDTSLMALNDNGSPFSEIADVIESEPDGLFAA